MHDDFSDTIQLPRRAAPMDFRPASYEAAHAASEIDDAARKALRERVIGARIGFSSLLLSAALVLGIAAFAIWY